MYSPLDKRACRNTHEHKRIKISGDYECDLRLTADTIYTLCGRVVIQPGVNLYIEPGTIIEADKDSNAELVISQGAHVCASGTEEKPIVFTSAELCPQPGDWVGIRIHGYSPVSQPLNPLQICDSRCRVSDSGIFRYVRVEYAGDLGEDSEIAAGVSFIGVTNRTQVDHVQVSYSRGDSFLFSGGDLDANYLVSYKPQAAGFRMVRGFRGHLQFIFDIHDSCSRTGAAGLVFQQEPFPISRDIPPVNLAEEFLLLTTAVVSHATLIGPLESGEDNGHYNTGIFLQSGGLGEVHNSIISGWQTGLTVGELLLSELIARQDLQLQANIFGAATPIFFTNDVGDLSRDRLEVLNSFNAFLAIPDVFAFFCEECYVPRRRTTLNAQTAYYSSGLMDPFFKVVDYRGAFGTRDWTCGWIEYVPC